MAAYDWRESTMFRTPLTIAAVMAALALPAGALAMHGPSSDQTDRLSAVPVSANLLRDGKYLPPPTTPDRATVQVVRVVKPGGFDFRDAGIGGALGAIAVAVVGGLVIVVLRDSDTATVSANAG
jgi:hypothetical protein